VGWQFGKMQMASKFPGSFKQQHYTKSQVLGLFADFLRERRLTEIDARIVREFCKLHDCAPVYYAYVLQIAKKSHLIRKVESGPVSSWKVSPLVHENARCPHSFLGREQKH
jgi:hypothetical protein